MQIRQEKGCYTLYKENEAIGTAVVDGTTILRLEVVPPVARARLRQLSVERASAPKRRTGPKAGHLLHGSPAPGCRGQGAGAKIWLCPGRQPAGAPPRTRPVRRAALPCVFDRTARPRRAVRGCHLRQRPRHAVPVYAGRPGRARAGPGIFNSRPLIITNARLAAAGYGAVGRAVLHDHARPG